MIPPSKVVRFCSHDEYLWQVYGIAIQSVTTNSCDLWKNGTQTIPIDKLVEVALISAYAGAGGMSYGSRRRFS